jgi:hypothetical protein
MPARTTKKNLTVFRQLCEFIPTHLVSSLAKECEVVTRSFSAWSHVVSLIYAHVTRAVGLNDVCDSLDLYQTQLRNIRGATPPKRNTFSNANRTRNPEMAQRLYWKMLDILQRAEPSFSRGNMRSGYLKRFKASIFAVDSTTISLVANCMDWAKHRRRKAAAKCHMSLNLKNMLPRFAVVDTAAQHDSRRAWDVCARLQEGEIVVFDRAYMDFLHLGALARRGVFWVTRQKGVVKYRVKKTLKNTGNSRILLDQIIQLTGKEASGHYSGELRRVVARVEVDGKLKDMVFLTNNLEWSAWSVAELYKARWEIEVFFKQLKQCIQLVDFVGNNKEAVLWQVWIGLLTHLLMRFMAHLSRWGHSFTRLSTLLRAACWQNYSIVDFLKTYGTAGGSYRMMSRPEQLYFPGFGAPEEFRMGQPKRKKPFERKKYEENIQRKNPEPATSPA